MSVIVPDAMRKCKTLLASAALADDNILDLRPRTPPVHGGPGHGHVAASPGGKTGSPGSSPVDAAPSDHRPARRLGRRIGPLGPVVPRPVALLSRLSQ